jgi:hypothetical protein
MAADLNEVNPDGQLGIGDCGVDCQHSVSRVRSGIDEMTLDGQTNGNSHSGKRNVLVKDCRKVVASASHGALAETEGDREKQRAERPESESRPRCKFTFAFTPTSLLPQLRGVPSTYLSRYLLPSFLPPA